MILIGFLEGVFVSAASAEPGFSAAPSLSFLSFALQIANDDIRLGLRLAVALAGSSFEVDDDAFVTL